MPRGTPLNASGPNGESALSPGKAVPSSAIGRPGPPPDGNASPPQNLEAASRPASRVGTAGPAYLAASM
jgi:hypothetical protein